MNDPLGPTILRSAQCAELVGIPQKLVGRTGPFIGGRTLSKEKVAFSQIIFSEGGDPPLKRKSVLNMSLKQWF